MGKLVTWPIMGGGAPPSPSHHSVGDASFRARRPCHSAEGTPLHPLWMMLPIAPPEARRLLSPGDSRPNAVTTPAKSQSRNRQNEATFAILAIANRGARIV